MYQFYYAENEIKSKPIYQRNIQDEIKITAIRPTVWEEHCLECSAPVCFSSCVHYIPRKDGRCKRFDDGIFVYPNELGCGGQAARITFRKWANMMTHLFPAMVPVKAYKKTVDNNQYLGNQIRKVVNCPLPINPKFTIIRTLEYARRRKLYSLGEVACKPDAFVFHGYSFNKKPYKLIVEVFEDHRSRFKMSMDIRPGENMEIVDVSRLTDACWTKGFFVKVYPENDFEAELEILWCDFVQGTILQKEKPADKVKCVVWDLDNTVWDGTLIETEDINQLRPKNGVIETMKMLDERGIIQSIASKNDYDLAWQVVERLGLSDYFLYPQIHWNAKSASIEQIAKNLNIGIDTFALIDDSVFERNQVTSALPQVRVYDVSEIDKLLAKPEFSVMVTEESRSRRAMYRAEEQRNQLMVNDNSGTVSFLKKCHLSITLFEPKTEEEITRCFELVVRTNQLNMSGKKYSEIEFHEVLNREEHKSFAFSCKDDFGSYGIVGFGQYEIQEGTLLFTEFAMSCRVAGKYVESALFSELLRKEQCKTGTFAVNITKKNILLRRTLEEIGFEKKKETSDGVIYSFNDTLLNHNVVSVTER